MVIRDEVVRVTSELSDDAWREIAARADVNIPSEQSKLRIIEILKGKP